MNGSGRKVFSGKLKPFVETKFISEGSTGIIAEFKRKSPSKGWFKTKELEVEPVVTYYNSKGAAGISVLTDEEFFGGDLDDLIQTKVIPISRCFAKILSWMNGRSPKPKHLEPM